MKITYHRFNAVGSWRWDLKPITSSTTHNPSEVNDGISCSSDEDELNDDEEEDDDDDDDDEVCGICQLEFESSCPGCKVPGDDCPLMWGQCTHVFHMHCLLKWLNTESSKEQCPLDRRPWVTAERNTGEAHGAPLPLTTPGTTGTTPMTPGMSDIRRTTETARTRGSVVGDEETSRSMMTIGEDSFVDAGVEEGRAMAAMAAGEEQEGEDEGDDVELRMAIEASRAALGM